MGFPNGHILIIMGIQCVNPRGHNDLTSDALCKGTIPKCVKTEGFYADFLMRLFVGFGVNLTQKKNASHGLFAGICFNSKIRYSTARAFQRNAGGNGITKYPFSWHNL